VCETHLKKNFSAHSREFAEEKLELNFCDIAVFEEALTHSSYLNENHSEKLNSNERLEFLGDAVINMTIAEELFNRYPDKNEGDLTKLRAMIVNGSTLALAAKKIGVVPHIRAGKGEIPVSGQFKDSIMENVFEAIVGSILVDQGYPSAKVFTLRVLGEYLENVTTPLMIYNPKAILQEWVHLNRKVLPEYIVTRETGKPPQKIFEIEVSVSGTVVGIGTGSRKIEAEKEAALAAIRQLHIDI
jgi:ribonuclease-3